jgi:hypothetical protein
MKVLICGSRSWQNKTLIRDVVRGLPDGTLVIAGGARGADTYARCCAHDCGLYVAEVAVTDAHWMQLGRRAGLVRNAAMLSLAPDLVVAFQCGESRGTQDTINSARRLGIPVEVHTE